MEDLFSPCFKCEYRRTGCHSICTPYKIYQQKLVDEKAFVEDHKKKLGKTDNTRAKHWSKKWFKGQR